MESDGWICVFAICCGHNAEADEISIKLQGQRAFAHELHLEVKAIHSKLGLLAMLLNEQNFIHFYLFKTRSVAQQLSDKCASPLMSLQQEFIRRFVDLKVFEGLFDLLNSTFALDIETTTEE